MIAPLQETETEDAPEPAGGRGVVVGVDGSVVDVRFAEIDPPEINTALLVRWDRPSGLLLEV